MSDRRPILLVLLALALAGCGSFRSDLQTMCDTPKRFPREGVNPAERAMNIAQYWEKSIRSRDGKEYLRAMSFVVSSADKSELFAETLREQGMDPATCLLLTELRETPPPPSPG